MYKLTAIDIDGTLLDDNDHLSSVVKQTVEKAVQNDHIILLCSGRSPMTLGVVGSLFDFDLPVACFHGGLVLFDQGEDVLYKRALAKEDAIFLYDQAEKQGVDAFHLWTMDGILAINRITDKTMTYRKKTHYKTDPLIISEHPEIFDREIAKVMWYDDVEIINRCLAQAPQMLTGRNVDASTSQPEYLEFVHTEANKGSAILYVAEQFGIAQEETMAIGDGLNDIPMIKAAGLGVAMGNANPKVKEAADVIGPTNNEDGVASILKKYVLEA